MDGFLSKEEADTIIKESERKFERGVEPKDFIGVLQGLSLKEGLKIIEKRKAESEEALKSGLPVVGPRYKIDFPPVSVFVRGPEEIPKDAEYDPEIVTYKPKKTTTTVTPFIGERIPVASRLIKKGEIVFEDTDENTLPDHGWSYPERDWKDMTEDLWYEHFKNYIETSTRLCNVVAVVGGDHLFPVFVARRDIEEGEEISWYKGFSFWATHTLGKITTENLNKLFGCDGVEYTGSPTEPLRNFIMDVNKPPESPVPNEVLSQTCTVC